MEIIKHGDPEKLKGTKYFVCNKCGCEFKADNTEYEERLVEFISAVEYVIACPECGKETVGADPQKPKKSSRELKLMISAKSMIVITMLSQYVSAVMNTALGRKLENRMIGINGVLNLESDVIENNFINTRTNNLSYCCCHIINRSA